VECSNDVFGLNAINKSTRLRVVMVSVIMPNVEASLTLLSEKEGCSSLKLIKRLVCTRV